MDLSGVGAIVTGGASGLGGATARALAEAGARVVVVDLNEEAGRASADAIGGRFVRADVTDPAAVQRAVDEAADAPRGLRAVVQCAGIVLAARTLGREGPHDLDRFRKVIEVNLIGTFNVARLAAARMQGNEPDGEGERGALVHTSSVAAFEGQIGQAAYGASKGGVAALTLPLARELARDGIRVMTIAPGIFDTPMMAGLPDAARASLGAQVPFPSRLGRPEEYARLAVSILENPMLNGETIRLDGAIRMAPK